MNLYLHEFRVPVAPERAAPDTMSPIKTIPTHPGFAVAAVARVADVYGPHLLESGSVAVTSSVGLPSWTASANSVGMTGTRLMASNSACAHASAT